MPRSIVRWLPFVVVVVAITVVSLSSSVTQWWDVQSAPGTSSLPDAADQVLGARPDSSDADVHTVLWFGAALALVWAMRGHGWRRLMAAAAALWVYTGVLEVAQRWVPSRTAQWVDLAGNALGVVAGLAVGSAAIAGWRRVSGRAQRAGGESDDKRPDARPRSATPSS